MLVEPLNLGAQIVRYHVQVLARQASSELSRLKHRNNEAQHTHQIHLYPTPHILNLNPQPWSKCTPSPVANSAPMWFVLLIPSARQATIGRTTRSKKNWNWKLTTIEHSLQWSPSVRSLEELLCQWEDRPQRRPKDHRSMRRVLTRRASSSTSRSLPEANWKHTMSNSIIGTS